MNCEKSLSLEKHEDPKELKWRKKLFLAMVLLRNFIANMEYSVIMPSIYLYMHSLGHGKVVTGLVIGMYPLASIMGMPIAGYVYDKTLRICELMHFTATLHIIGSVMYALPYSIAFPLLGRFISGLGFCFVVCATGEATYLYPGKERLRTMSLIEMGKMIGFLVGPGITLLIKDVNIEICGWKINHLNMPSLVMAFLWTLLQMMAVVTFRNTVKDFEIKKINKEKLKEQEENSNSNEKQPLLVIKQGYWSVLREACCSVEFGAIFYVEVLGRFIQVQLEILIAYIPEIDFGWSVTSTSYIYIVAGICTTIIFLLISIFSKRYPVHESYLLTMAVSIAQLSIIFLMIEASSAPSPTAKIALYYSMAVGMFVFSPLNMVCARTLVTKLYPAKVQGMLQAVFMTSSRVAMATAPLLISAFYESRIFYFLVLSVFNILSAIFLLTCRRRFLVKESQNNKGHY